MRRHDPCEEDHNTMTGRRVRVTDARMGDARVGDTRVGDTRVGDTRVGDTSASTLSLRGVPHGGVHAPTRPSPLALSYAERMNQTFARYAVDQWTGGGGKIGKRGKMF